MQTKIRNVILNITALIGFFAGIYPAVIILRLFSFEYVSRPQDLLVSVITILSGYAVSGLVIGDGKETSDKYVAYLSFREVAVYISIIVPFFISIMGYIHGGLWRILIEVFVSVILYYLGLSAHFTDYTNIISGQKVLLGSILLSFSLLSAIYLFKDIDLKNMILFYGYIFIVVTLIVKNQDNLERIFTAGNKLEYSVPKYIRSFNILGVVSVFLIMLVIFYAKPIAMYLLQNLWIVIRYIIRLIMMIIYYLSKTGNPSGDSGEGGGGMPDLPKDDGNPLADMIFYVILISAVAIAIFMWGPRLCREIIKGLKILIKKIEQLIKKIFKKWEKTSEAIEYYVDEDEYIKPEDNDKPKFDILMRLGLKRKSEEKLRNIADPVLKVRFIYKFIVSFINKENVKISPADTTGEILNKTVNIDVIQPHFTEMTDIYEKTRYGGLIPDKDAVTQAENMFKMIISNLKKVK